MIFQRTDAEFQPYHGACATESGARPEKRVEDTAAEVLAGERKQVILDFIAMQEMAESPWQPDSEVDRWAVILQHSAGRRYDRRALSGCRRALNDLRRHSDLLALPVIDGIHNPKFTNVLYTTYTCTMAEQTQFACRQLDLQSTIFPERFPGATVIITYCLGQYSAR